MDSVEAVVTTPRLIEKNESTNRAKGIILVTYIKVSLI